MLVWNTHCAVFDYKLWNYEVCKFSQIFSPMLMLKIDIFHTACKRQMCQWDQGIWDVVGECGGPFISLFCICFFNLDAPDFSAIIIIILQFSLLVLTSFEIGILFWCLPITPQWYIHLQMFKKSKFLFVLLNTIYYE